MFGWTAPLHHDEFPLCISFLYSNSLSFLWLHLLWCLLPLHFTYSKILVGKKKTDEDSKTSRTRIKKKNKEIDGAV